MLKILLVIGGVWFSFAVVFVLAMAAAAKKPIPPETVVTESAPAAAPEPILADTRNSSDQPARHAGPSKRRVGWQVSKPARA